MAGEPISVIRWHAYAAIASICIIAQSITMTFVCPSFTFIYVFHFVEKDKCVNNYKFFKLAPRHTRTRGIV